MELSIRLISGAFGGGVGGGVVLAIDGAIKNWMGK